MKKILIAINFDEGLYEFRRELLESLLQIPYEVHIALPDGAYIERLRKLGCIFHETPMRRRGKNPLEELALLSCYRKLLKDVRPDAVLTYTIKPNLYMGFLCGQLGIPYITTITGLGTAVEGTGLLQYGTRFLYRVAMRRAFCVFFQNEANEGLFREKRIASGRHRMLPGSGVNLKHFAYQPFPEQDTVEFLFISRILKEKGIEEFLDMAQRIRKKYSYTRFRVLGFYEEDYAGKERFERLQREGVICYEGNVEDVRPYLQRAQCTVHPSYYPEGMSNVCLESAACGRVVITTRRPGCQETVKEDVTGFLVEARNSRDVTAAVERFLALTHAEREAMGRAAREYMEERFDRRIVVGKYLRTLREVLESEENK